MRESPVLVWVNRAFSSDVTMIHGYHIILPMYGFWLPNDPRGSWSDFIRHWELLLHGKASWSPERLEMEELSSEQRRQRDSAKNQLTYSSVSVDGLQARAIGRGFASQIRTSNYTVWACSVLPEHTHLVLARHTYKAEQMTSLLKGAATRQIIKEKMHPLADLAQPGARPPRMWSSGEWIVYLDNEEGIQRAIQYVEDNPVKEGKRRQNWSFVTEFTGISTAGWITYH